MEKKLCSYYIDKFCVDKNLFENVTVLLKSLLITDKQNVNNQEVENFKDSFKELLKAFPRFIYLKKEDVSVYNDKKALYGNEDLIHCAMGFICLQIKQLSRFGNEVYIGKGIANIFLINEKRNKACVIELKYNDTAQAAIEQIKTKEYAKKISSEMNTLIFGINVSQDKEVDMICFEILKEN
ncbi:uncharacterized protein LOC105844774 [Hydra vulgaris]|uniref:uncharacterized protein LOC105844774 n=1 Tax=Hydra vulgaris TaxID=6087 RepID=UPI001F5EEE12|nr:uncharacterized protein LOC105844774 [Hydra vulgaris]